MSKTAIITGITGQDGSHLADLLLKKRYRVLGIVRRTSTEPPSRMRKDLWDKVIPFQGDVTDSYSIQRVLQEYQPSEFYNLAAQSHVGDSWRQLKVTFDVDLLGVLNILEGIHLLSPHTRFYQASTSEMFGLVEGEYQSETSRFYPRSPYAVAKLAAHWLTVNYRESYGLFACSGILFNHEGPRRGRDFVTRKITDHVARYSLGMTTSPLQLGNLNSMRDWGYAPDYVDAMWRILQQDTPQDFVIGTGESRSVRDFVNAAFDVIGIRINWSGENETEKGTRSDTGEVVVKVTPGFFRPAEVEFLRADATKARQILGWQPTVTFSQLVRIMVENDLTELAG